MIDLLKFSVFSLFAIMLLSAAGLVVARRMLGDGRFDGEFDD